MKTLKNWWLAILGFILVTLDQGFEMLNPILIDIGLPQNYINILKFLFGIYGIYKLKVQLPTNNKDKLKEIVKTKLDK